WNLSVDTVPGWPSKRLPEPPTKKRAIGPSWEAFPIGLRQEVDAYLSTLARPRRTRTGPLLRPCKPSTIDLRRRQIALAGKAAVSLGVPISSIESLEVLLDPDLVQKVLDAFW